MTAVGFIPARFASTRFKGKVIADLCGKPLLRWVWENASRSKLLAEVIVCADTGKVAGVAASFGAKVLMTPPTLRSGTERIAYAVHRYAIKADIVVNIQADEPFLRTPDIDLLVKTLRHEKKAVVATLKTRLLREIDNPNIVKVVTDCRGYALYFSRLPIPGIRDTMDSCSGTVRYWQHVGIYAYRGDFIRRFRSLKPSALETAEKLEQLRFLENGYAVKVAEISSAHKGIDTPEDLKEAERIIRKGYG